MDLWLHVAYGSFKRQSSFLAGGVVKRYFGCPRCYYASRCVCCSRGIGKWPAVSRAQSDAVYCCRRCRLDYQMAVRRVESERRESNQKAALDLIAEYQNLIRRLELAEDTGAAIPPLVQDELDLRKVGVQGELYALDDLWRENKIMSKSYAKAHKQLQHRLDDLNSMAKRSGRPR